ncbi:MAG TPA: hypothetical protein VIJ97_02360, partial [Candidatus Anoxymicrobiaceae bacterium]
GTLVSMTNAAGSVYMSATDATPTASAVAFSLTQVVSKLDFTETPTSQQTAATFASNEIKKIDLQYDYLPIGFLILGIVCTLIGWFTAIKEE